MIDYIWIESHRINRIIKNLIKSTEFYLLDILFFNLKLSSSPILVMDFSNQAAIKASFVCRKVISFWKVNSGKSEFLESEFRESIFRCLAVLWKMN